MYLLIDNSEKQVCKLGLLKDTKFIQQTYKNINYKPVLLFVDKFVSVNKINLKKLLGICFVVGSGSFTSTRIASVTANTLSYAYKIPVASIPVFDPKLVSAKIFKLGQYASPKYSGEASIGKPKKSK